MTVKEEVRGNYDDDARISKKTSAKFGDDSSTAPIIIWASLALVRIHTPAVSPQALSRYLTLAGWSSRHKTLVIAITWVFWAVELATGLSIRKYENIFRLSPHCLPITFSHKYSAYPCLCRLDTTV